MGKGKDGVRGTEGREMPRRRKRRRRKEGTRERYMEIRKRIRLTDLMSNACFST